MDKPTYLGFPQDGEGKIITSISYEDSMKDRPRGIIKYTMPVPYAGQIPDEEPNSMTEFFPETMKLVKRHATGTDAGTTEVTLTYETIDTTEIDGRNEPAYKLSTQTVNVSILLHPRFATIPEKEKVLLKAYLDGTPPDAKISLSESSLAIKANEQSTLTLLAAMKKHIQSDAGKKLFTKIKAGVKEYREARLTWTETAYSATLKSRAAQIGKIDRPPGNPPAGSWLLEKIDAEKTRSANAWRITTTWQCAAPGAAWDKDLY